MEKTKINPLINWRAGFFVQTNDCLWKISIKDNVKTTVKKYLAQVICKTSIDKLRYLAKASMTGTIIQAEAFKIIAFIKEGYLLIEVF